MRKLRLTEFTQLAQVSHLVNSANLSVFKCSPLITMLKPLPDLISLSDKNTETLSAQHKKSKELRQ